MATSSSAILLVRGGPNDGSAIDLSGGVTWIGRSPSNDIVVEDVGVSRQHVGIRQDRMGYWIKDMGSRNGTFINGARLQGEGQRLRHMDRIELGGTGDVHWIFKETKPSQSVSGLSPE